MQLTCRSPVSQRGDTNTDHERELRHRHTGSVRLVQLSAHLARRAEAPEHELLRAGLALLGAPSPVAGMSHPASAKANSATPARTHCCFTRIIGLLVGCASSVSSTGVENRPYCVGILYGFSMNAARTFSELPSTPTRVPKPHWYRTVNDP